MIQRGARHPPVNHPPPTMPPAPGPHPPPRPPGAAVAPPPPPGPPCSACLLPMVALAGVAGVFVVVSAVLGERLFRGARAARAVPSTWRRGGELWIEPAAPARPAGPAAAGAGGLWIPRPAPGAADWDRGPAGSSGSGDSSGVHSAGPESAGSSAALWDGEEPAWGAQPHVTLQDISEFFRRGGGGLGRGP